MEISLSRFRAHIDLLRPPLAPMDLAMPAASALLASYAVGGSYVQGLWGGSCQADVVR